MAHRNYIRGNKLTIISLWRDSYLRQWARYRKRGNIDIVIEGFSITISIVEVLIHDIQEIYIYTIRKNNTIR